MTNEERWLLNEKYGGTDSAAFREDAARLAGGEPLAYLIGSIPFLGATIGLSSRPLIPRAETEYWVSFVLAEIGKKNGGVRILDLCAGSGAIGVALACSLPHAQVHFAEIDAAHHATIRENCAQNGIAEDRTKIIGGDLFEEVRGEYDYILSNPPYLAYGSPEIETSVRDHEPPLALYAADDGFALIRRIIEGAGAHLAPGGSLYIEHDPHHATPLSACAEANDFDCHTLLDQYGLPRVCVLSFRK
jgi:release factor glutamine methyltransferase